MMSYWNQNETREMTEEQLLYKILKEQKVKEDTNKINEFRQKLPTECRKCHILTIIDIEKQKAYCPYMINDKCILN